MALPLVAGTRFVGDQAEGYGPRDGLVVVSGGGEVHRMGQTSLRVEPAIALPREFGNRMLARRKPARRVGWSRRPQRLWRRSRRTAGCDVARRGSRPTRSLDNQSHR